jgi:periplasmic protein TonB
MGARRTTAVNKSLRTQSVATARGLTRLSRSGGADEKQAMNILLAAGFLAASVAASSPALAQFDSVPLPAQVAAASVSEAKTPQEYRRDAARRVYDSFPQHIHRGKLPPLMYAIAITETDVDANGKVLDVRLTREPAAAKEVGPWVVALLRRIGQFPAPARLARVTYKEIWLVDKSGKFQLDTLTEGQRSGS